MAINIEKLGKRIRNIRDRKGMSQEQLSGLLSINRETIAKIETGKRGLSIDLLVKIANVLNVSADDLLIDSLEYSVSTANSEIHQLLLDCNKTEEKILTETVKHLKTALIRQGI